MQGSDLAHWGAGRGECKFRSKWLVRSKGRTWSPQNPPSGEAGGRLGSHTSWRGDGTSITSRVSREKNDADFPKDKYTVIMLTRARSGTFKPLLGTGPSFSNLKTNFARLRCWLKSPSPEARTQLRRAWPRNALRRLPLSRWQRAEAGSS